MQRSSSAADRRFLTAMAGLFVGIGLLLLPSRLAEPPEQTFLDDAGDYQRGAVSLLRDGMYSSDGRTPTNEREPGYSLFLASVEGIGGIGNRTAIFLAQLALYAVCALLFLRALQPLLPGMAVRISGAFLFFSPAVYHLALFVYRESVALSLSLLFLTALLHWNRFPSRRSAVAAGLCGGILAITYLPLLPVTLLQLAAMRMLTIRWKHIGIALLALLIPLGLWAGRNALHRQTQHCLLGGCTRSAIALYARSRQATDLPGFMPLQCLWAEYVTTHHANTVSRSCDFGTISDVSITSATAAQVKADAERVLLTHPVGYLKTSLAWLLEYHFPYVNGWGFLYNMLETIATTFLLLGCILSLRTRKREMLLFCIPVIGAAILFALVDVEPRYRMPSLGSYAALAGIGYAALLRHGRITA